MPVTPRPWSSAPPPATPPRHARSASGGAWWPVAGVAARVAGARTGRALAAGVVALGFVGGAGTAAVIDPFAPQDRAGVIEPAGTAAQAGLAGVVEPAGAPAAAGPDGSPVRTRATVPPAAPATAVADVRAVPLPQLVDRDTVGPVWLTPEDRAAGLLALEVPESASGELDVVPGATAAPGSAGGRSVRVEVERGLPVDGAAFAETVMATLNDPRGWGAGGAVTFARTDGPADLRVVLASPRTVDAMCAPLATDGEVSCGRDGHAVLNFRRWVLATDEFADRTQYRQYLVNHEVGHLLGHSHERCPGTGELAPIMQQQSIAVAPCVPNGWPYPQG